MESLCFFLIWNKFLLTLRIGGACGRSFRLNILVAMVARALAGLEGLLGEDGFGPRGESNSALRMYLSSPLGVINCHSAEWLLF